MYYDVVTRDGRGRIHKTLAAAKKEAQKIANASGEEVNVYHKYDSGKTKSFAARIYPSMKSNPAPEPMWVVYTTPTKHGGREFGRYKYRADALASYERLKDSGKTAVIVKDGSEQQRNLLAGYAIRDAKTYKRNPAPKAAATVYEVIQSQGKGKPWVVRVATDDRAKARGVLDYLRQTERGSFLVREVRPDAYRRNPTVERGLGYWSFRSPETGEMMRYPSRERAENAARKIAKRTLSRIVVKEDW